MPQPHVLKRIENCTSKQALNQLQYTFSAAPDVLQLSVFTS
jgi:hypothetical protein